jgi:hypothetical protein
MVMTFKNLRFSPASVMPELRTRLGKQPICDKAAVEKKRNKIEVTIFLVQILLPRSKQVFTLCGITQKDD